MAWSWIFEHEQSNGAASGDTIDDELQFHLRSLVDEELAKGQTPEAAWQHAHDRFGSLEHYAKQCHNISQRGHIMWQKLLTVGLVVLAFLAGRLLFEVQTLRQENVVLRTAQERRELAEQVRSKAATQLAASNQAAVVPASLNTAGEAVKKLDITGRVVGPGERPLADAKVLVILKTWPNNRYRQDDYCATTDADGRFTLPELVPSRGQYAIHAAVAEPGHALTASYQLVPDGTHERVEPIALQCDPAARLALIVRDAQGQPVSGARWFPSSRKVAGGGANAEHVVYFQASKPIQALTDAEGRADLSCFGRGDMAEIYLQLPGEDWKRRQIDIPVEGDTIVMSTEGIDLK